MKKYCEFLPSGGRFTSHLDAAFDRIEGAPETRTAMLHDSSRDICVRVAPCPRDSLWHAPGRYSIDDCGYISRMMSHLDNCEKKIFLQFFNAATKGLYSCRGEHSGESYARTSCHSCKGGRVPSVAYDLWQWCIMARVSTGMMAPVRKFPRRKNKSIKLFKNSGKFSLYASRYAPSLSRDPDGRVVARVCDSEGSPTISVEHTASGRGASVYDDGYIYDTASRLMTRPELEFFLKILSSWWIYPQPTASPLIMGVLCPTKKVNLALYHLSRAVYAVYAIKNSLTSE